MSFSLLTERRLGMLPIASKEEAMAAFGVYPEKRAAQLKNVAWRWLLHKTQGLTGRELGAVEIRKRFSRFRMPNRDLYLEHRTEFCDDLVEAVLELARRHEEGSTVRLADEVRDQVAYEVLVGWLFEECVQVGRHLRSDVISRAREVSAKQKDVADLMKMVLRDLVALSLNGVHE